MHRSLAGLALTGLVLSGCGAPASGPGSAGAPASGAPASSSTAASGAPSASAPASPSGSSATSVATYTVAPSSQRVVVADGLDHPWSVVHLPDGSILFDQRANKQLYRLKPGTGEPAVAVGSVDEVAPAYEGGMLGMALSPSFAADGFVYLYLTTTSDERIVRLHWNGEALNRDRDILTGIPKGAMYHHGGRIAFGPDGKLYAGTGDAKNGQLAQDTNSLGGKVLRLNPDGSVPSDNPFGNPVWSYGHRNVEGLGWDAQGRLLVSELGENTYDELNVIEKGKNYGWPTVEGPGGAARGFVDPVATWRPTSSCSPSGIAVTSGAVYVACLAGKQLSKVTWDGTIAGTPTTLLSGLGRVRDVHTGPDGRLWVLTDNGSDDQILVLPDR